MNSHLEPDRELRDDLTQQVVAYLASWYDGASNSEAWGVDLVPDTLRELRRAPTEEGRDLESILSDLTVAGKDGIYHLSGGHMSYIPNAGLYTAALAEFLAAALNRYTGVAGAVPGFTAIEHGVIDWMTSLFDLGPEASGVLLSGGSMANLTGIVTARFSQLGDGFSAGVMYATPHTHHSVAKAARIAGFRDDQIVSMDTDADLRMDVGKLQERIASDRKAGRHPFLIIASAGTTDTGTVDPLDHLADVAAESDIWFHVDAAYGGFFQLTTRGKDVLHGIERADTIALDPHKGLSIPFGAGALLARRETQLLAAHHGRWGYLTDDDTYMGLRDIASLGPELSRPFRGLPVWLPLQLHGVAAFREALDSSLDLAEHAYNRLGTIEGIDARWTPDLSVVAFMFDDDEVGRSAWEAVNTDRTVHISPTIIEDRFVLRFAILNRRSTVEHVDYAIDIIEKTLIG
ncbi:MAG: aspartate aminotransferase family protein [Acidimicrobiia bacterium]